MNIRDAFVICNPLATPNWPALPADYYDTEAEIRARFMDSRRQEIADDPIQLGDALNQYLELHTAQFVAVIQKSCGGTLIAAIDLQDMVDKAVDTMIDKEWNGRGEE